MPATTVDTTAGRLLVGGTATLLVSLDKWWGWDGSGGWLRSSDVPAKHTEAANAGFNAIAQCNWLGSPVTADDAFSTYGFYSWLAAAQQVVVDGRNFADIVPTYKAKAYLLGWQPTHEFNIQYRTQAQWEVDKATIDGYDATPHVTGDLFVMLVGAPYRTDANNEYRFMQAPLPECSISEFSKNSRIARIYDELLLQQRMWDEGFRFIRQISLTVVSEYASYIGSCVPGIPTRAEIFRAFVLSAAMNCRGFDVLWGANQNINCTAQNVEDQRASVNTAWTDTKDAVTFITGATVKAVILDSGTFAKITGATPSIQHPSDYTGVYAATKTVGGTTYIAAVNLSDAAINAIIPTSAATATDLIENAAATVSSGAIRDTIPANTARFYQMAGVGGGGGGGGSAQTLYLKDAAASVHRALQNGGTAPTDATTGTGWDVGTIVPTAYHLMKANQVPGPFTFVNSPAYPESGIDTTNGDCWRTENTLTGDFASDNWQFDFEMIGSDAGDADGTVRFRLYRGTNADGTGATEITSVAQACATITNLGGTKQLASLTLNPGAFTVTAEYLFVQCAWVISGGSAAGQTVKFCVGTNSKIVTAALTTGTAHTLIGAASVSITITGALTRRRGRAQIRLGRRFG